jgi:prophage regulatory protein
MDDVLIRLDEVVSATSLKRSTIYKYMRLGKFPKQKGGTFGIAAWRLSDVNSWIASDKWPPIDGGDDET